MRLLDLNDDGYLDVVIGRAGSADAPAGAIRSTRLWSPADRQWREADFPTSVVYHDAIGQSRSGGAAFGIVAGHPHGSCKPSLDPGGAPIQSMAAGLKSRHCLAGLHDDDGVEIQTAGEGGERGVRLRDLDGDGRCELIVGNPRQNAVLRWSAKSESLGAAAVQAAGGVRASLTTKAATPVCASSTSTKTASSMCSFPTTSVIRCTCSSRWRKAGRAGAMAGKRGEPPKTGRGDSADRYGGNQRRRVVPFAAPLVAERIDRSLAGPGRSPVVQRAVGEGRAAGEVARSCRPGFHPRAAGVSRRTGRRRAAGDGPDRLRLGARRQALGRRDGRLPAAATTAGASPAGVCAGLEDTDGDGRYDRSTVFLDGLFVPTGVMPWRKGVLVTAAPDLVYAEDTDGDGKADKREALFTGFGEGNQQHRVNGLRWGLDNWIYGANGDSGGEVKSIKTGTGRRTSAAAISRIRPDTGEIEAVGGQVAVRPRAGRLGQLVRQQQLQPDVALRARRALPPPQSARARRPTATCTCRQLPGTRRCFRSAARCRGSTTSHGQPLHVGVQRDHLPRRPVWAASSRATASSASRCTTSSIARCSARARRDASRAAARRTRTRASSWRRATTGSARR